MHSLNTTVEDAETALFRCMASIAWSKIIDFCPQAPPSQEDDGVCENRLRQLGKDAGVDQTLYLDAEAVPTIPGLTWQRLMALARVDVYGWLRKSGAWTSDIDTGVNPEPLRGGGELDACADRQVRRVLSLSNWFYLKATEAYVSDLEE